MTDTEIISLIKRDDPQGLSTAYETFRTEFIHWLMKFQRCTNEEAREYYQAAILILYDNIHGGKIDSLRSSLKTYLFGIGKNLVWQHFRNNHREQVIGAEFYLKNHVNEDADLQMEEEINLDVLSNSFGQLGEPCHELLDQYYFRKKNMEEIAAAMGYKNPETAKNQKYKCMERLRKIVFGSVPTGQGSAADRKAINEPKNV
jgi:RNA polymerase sigma-70 factor (ECF subfamily)